MDNTFRRMTASEAANFSRCFIEKIKDLALTIDNYILSIRAKVDFFELQLGID